METNSNIGLNNNPNDKIMHRQQASTFDTNDRDSQYPNKRTLTRQTELTKLGVTQSKILKEPDKLSWV